MNRARLLLRNLFRRSRVEQELDEELQDHLQREIDAGIARGLPPDEARYAAFRSMGAITASKEECREMRRTRLFDDFARDMRYAIRSIARNPGFSTLGVLILALGIGANTAVFSVVNAVLLKPLGYDHPERIVAFRNIKVAGEPMSGLSGKLISQPNFKDWHDQSSSFEAMAYYGDRETPIVTQGASEYVHLAQVSPGFLGVFAITPILGRDFESGERRGLAGGVAMISYNFWQSHFGGSPDVLGKTIQAYNATLQIVGVLPPGFNFPRSSNVWIPTPPPSRPRYSQNDFAVGRLKPNVTLEHAQQEVRAIGLRLAQQYPDTNKDKTVTVDRILDDMVGDMRWTLYLLWGGVSVVLLIACANTATLLLGKATARAHEMGMRVALGAGRGRILRQLITESLLLSTIAGGLGLVIAHYGARALVSLAPELPRLSEVGVDARVLLFTLLVSILTSVVFSLVPALYSAKVDVKEALKVASSRSATAGPAARLRSALVVAEIAMAVVLLSAAALLLKSFQALQHVPLGFRPDNVLVMAATTPAGGVESSMFFKDVRERLATVPGVIAVGATMQPPGAITSSGPFFGDSLPEKPDPNSPQAAMSIVTPGSFAALGIPFHSGRDFTDEDRFGKPLVAIVNETLAKAAFPGKDPVGRKVYCPFDNTDPMTVIAVVADMHQGAPEQAPVPQCFMSYRQHPYNGNTLSVLVRTSSNPAAMTETVRQLVHERSATVPVKFTTMETIVAGNVAASRFRALLFTLFAGLAVCLACAGVYGVMAYAVNRRASEIGLRIALGATRGSVVRMVLQQSIRVAAIGLVLGLVATLGLTRFIEFMLYGVKSDDLGIYIAVSAILGLVTLLATYVPALRAARLDPMTALRQE